MRRLDCENERGKGAWHRISSLSGALPPDDLDARVRCVHCGRHFTRVIDETVEGGTRLIEIEKESAPNA